MQKNSIELIDLHDVVVFWRYYLAKLTSDNREGIAGSMTSVVSNDRWDDWYNKPTGEPYFAAIFDLVADLEMPSTKQDPRQKEWDKVAALLAGMESSLAKGQLSENPIQRNHGPGTDYSELEDSSIDTKLIEKVANLPYDKLAKVVLKAGIIFSNDRDDKPVRKEDLVGCLDEADTDELREAYNEINSNKGYDR
ncbi:MAG: hypothetical protein WCN86_02860 [bacterium]